MTSKGMWIIYENDSNLKKIKNIRKKDTKYIINKYYNYHHFLLEEKVNNILKINNTPIIIDCHSFCNNPLPYELIKDKIRPDICIGTDSYHTPIKLIEIYKDFLEKKGYLVYINNPFNGTIVPLKYYQDKRIISIMIEINKKLYCNEQTGKKNNNYNNIKSDLKELIKLIENTNIT